VVFVEEIEENPGVFMRLGTGRIADRMLIAELDEVEERAFRLI
jgi:hypothetical protein